MSLDGREDSLAEVCNNQLQNADLDIVVIVKLCILDTVDGLYSLI